MSKITTTEVKYRILVKSGSVCFKMGTILLKRLAGDIFYIPSQRKVINPNRGITNKIIDKIGWHKSGRVHFKMQDGSRDILEVGEGERNPPIVNVPQRQTIQNIGFQEILRDTIIDFSKLPKLTGDRDGLDVVLDINDYKGPIQFVFSIISGRLLAAIWNGKKTSIKEISDEARSRILASQKRCLGCESNNTDKLLQYTLFKYAGDETLLTGRRVFIAGNSKISRQV